MMGLFDMLAGMLKVRKEQINILVIGLNNSGKSTIVNHFKDPEERSQVTLPTVGFNVEKFQSEWYPSCVCVYSKNSGSMLCPNSV